MQIGEFGSPPVESARLGLRRPGLRSHRCDGGAGARRADFAPLDEAGRPDEFQPVSLQHPAIQGPRGNPPREIGPVFARRRPRTDTSRRPCVAIHYDPGGRVQRNTSSSPLRDLARDKAPVSRIVAVSGRALPYPRRAVGIVLRFHQEGGIRIDARACILGFSSPQKRGGFPQSAPSKKSRTGSASKVRPARPKGRAHRPGGNASVYVVKASHAIQVPKASTTTIQTWKCRSKPAHCRLRQSALRGPAAVSAPSEARPNT